MITFTVKPTEDELETWPDLASELTGRVIYSFNEFYDDELSFYCGPETKEGFLLDCTDCGIYEQLKTLFKDMGLNFEIGAAENFHCIVLTPEDDNVILWNKVEARLIMAGAVEKK